MSCHSRMTEACKVSGISSRRSKKIPLVFTRDEAEQILLHLQGKYWLVSSLLYGFGVRLMEAMTLREENPRREGVNLVTLKLR